MNENKKSTFVIKTTIFQKIFFIIFGLFFSLVILEIFVRILPSNLTKIDFSILEDSRIFSLTREMKFRPNSTRVWTALGRPTIWHFNNLGYRERGIQIEKPENVYRVIFIGDSIVMGFGVEEYESLPRKLEDQLRPKIMDNKMTHFEILNLGIQGYSTPQYKAIVKEDVLRMKPNLVIIGFYTNDIPEAASFYANKKAIFLKSLPDLIPLRVNLFLKKHSRLFLILLNRYYSTVEKYSVSIKYDENTINSGWNLARNDLSEIKKILDKNNIQFVLLGIPNSKEEIEKKIISQKRINELNQISKDNNILYYDLYNDLIKYPNTKKLYIPDYDDHFSPEGNLFVAKLLKDYLIKNSIIPNTNLLK